MDIEINRPYSTEWSQIELQINNVVIKLYKNELEELFKVVDEELNFGETREDLLSKISKLEEAISYYQDQEEMEIK